MTGFEVLAGGAAVEMEVPSRWREVGFSGVVWGGKGGAVVVMVGSSASAMGSIIMVSLLSAVARAAAVCPGEEDEVKMLPCLNGVGEPFPRRCW